VTSSIASILKVEEKAEEETSVKVGGKQLFSEDVGDIFLRNFG
jgi:hypothetical protein